jgi:hypothetical protein
MLEFIMLGCWFAIAAVVIVIDRQLVDERSRHQEVPDLRGRRIWPWMALAVIFGAFTIPIYLWYSRRSVGAVFAGIGIVVAGIYYLNLAASVLSTLAQGLAT